jgi:hypothetical protein
MNILGNGLALVAMSTLLALPPANAQLYGGYQGGYDPDPYGYRHVQPTQQYMVPVPNLQPQLQEMRARVTNAMASGRIGRSDGQNLLQGVDQLQAQLSHQAASGVSPEQANSIAMQVTAFSQRIDTLFSMADSQRSRGIFGPRLNRGLGLYNNFWR